MLYELQTPALAAPLFEGWAETMLYSCLQGVMGKLYVTGEPPRAARAELGDFVFFGGRPCRELVEKQPSGFAILVPQDEGWAGLIEDRYPQCRRTTRYAIKKGTVFDREKLATLAARLPEGYSLSLIDGALYERCLENEWSRDFVSVFGSREAFLEKGLGVVALKGDELVAGASSYTRYRAGIEIEVDTRRDERRKGLATACCAGLILACLNRGLYPSWDAQNLQSVGLAEKLGYEFSHEYVVYEVEV